MPDTIDTYDLTDDELIELDEWGDVPAEEYEGEEE